MSEESEDGGAKRGKRLVPIALALALLLGGGSFYAVHSGLATLPFGLSPAPKAEMAAVGTEADDVPDPEIGPLPPAQQTAFVRMEPLIVSLGPNARAKHLKLSVDLEVVAGRETAVEGVLPRVRDVLNTFLRAVDEPVFEVPSAMPRLRAQMLRRVQLVTPEGSVRDVLIQEFLLN